MSNPDRNVIVSIKFVDSKLSTEFTIRRCDLNMTDRYVSFKIRQDTGSGTTEIFRPWHQIKELIISEVDDA